MQNKNLGYVVFLAIIAILILTHPVVVHILAGLLIVACICYIIYCIDDIVNMIKKFKERKDNNES